MLEVKIRNILTLKGMNKKDLAAKIEVQESLLSKWLSKDKITAAFLYKLIELWPELDLNYLLKDESNDYIIEDSISLVAEPGEKNTAAMINYHAEEIEKHTNALKKITKTI